MGYDYRTGASNPVGSVAPLGGPSYDISDTVASYVSRIPASKIILGVPYYGRAWSTDSAALHARNISGTQYGASTTVVYGTAIGFAAAHGRNWDSVEGVAWTAYRRQNCTAAYGCVTPWRELYYDDAQALGLKYDLINRAGLRGAGIWALGYDGTRPELYAMLKAKFITDTVPPRISSSTISQTIVSPNGDGRMDSTMIRVYVTGHIKFGWIVQPLLNGAAGVAVRSASITGKSVVVTWDGKDDAGKVVPDGSYRITVWTADASNNRASVVKTVVVDRTPAAVTLSAAPNAISPNGDGHGDKMTVAMHADAAISGSARILDKNGVQVRRWTFSQASSGTWTWDGRNSAGSRVADGRYTLRVWGLDRAGNGTIRSLTVRVDRTIRSVTWSRSSFIPRRPEGAGRIHARPSGGGDDLDPPRFDRRPLDLAGQVARRRRVPLDMERPDIGRCPCGARHVHGDGHRSELDRFVDLHPVDRRQVVRRPSVDRPAGRNTLD